MITDMPEKKGAGMPPMPGDMGGGMYYEWIAHTYAALMQGRRERTLLPFVFLTVLSDYTILIASNAHVYHLFLEFIEACPSMLC